MSIPTTDLEKFIELYHSFGIELKPTNDDNIKTITLNAGMHPKIKGYCMFFTEIEFDDAGVFISQGIWE